MPRSRKTKVEELFQIKTENAECDPGQRKKVVRTLDRTECGLDSIIALLVKFLISIIVL